MINLLKSNVTESQSGEMLKESSLETLGYICQDIDPRVLETKANDVLTAIIHGMRPEESSANVRFAATNALLNSLEFTNTNFSNEVRKKVFNLKVCSNERISQRYFSKMFRQFVMAIKKSSKEHKFFLVNFLRVIIMKFDRFRPVSLFQQIAHKLYFLFNDYFKFRPRETSSCKLFVNRRAAVINE